MGYWHFVASCFLAGEPGHVNYKVQVLKRTGKERVSLARFNDDHISSFQGDCLLLHAHLRRAACYQVNLGDPVVDVRFVNPLVRVPD